jgi:hypothetical protein
VETRGGFAFKRLTARDTAELRDTAVERHLPSLEPAPDAGSRARFLPSHTEPAARALARRDTATLALGAPPRPLLRTKVVKPELLPRRGVRGLGRSVGAAHDSHAARRASAERWGTWRGPAAGEGPRGGGEGGGRDVEEGGGGCEREEGDGGHSWRWKRERSLRV